MMKLSLLTPEEQIQKLKLHYSHYSQTFSNLLPESKPLVRQHLVKLERKLKLFD